MDEDQIRNAFEQIRNSPADKALTQLLEQAVRDAMATAIVAGKSDSDRSYDCGGAASIYAFADRINRLRQID